MIAVPDPTTLRLIPWREEETNRTARMICDIRVPGGEPYEGDPRWIMRRALERATGWASTTTSSAPSSSTSTSAPRIPRTTSPRSSTRAATST